MRFASFFRFLRARNWAALREDINRFLERRPRLVKFGKKAAKIILSLFKQIGKLLRWLGTPIVSFFNFFLYLNFSTVRQIVDRAGKQRLTGLSAEIAFHAMLSLFPALLAVIAAIGLFEPLQSTLFNLGRQLAEVIPEQVWDMITSLIREILRSRNQEVFSVGFVGALWAFSGAIGAGIAALDRIHQIPIEEARPFWKAKLVSIALAIGTIILLIVACFLVFVSDWVVQLLARRTCLLQSGQDCLRESGLLCLLQPLPSCELESRLLDLWHFWSRPLTLLIVSAAFAFLYFFGPSRRRHDTPLIPGAVVAALLWALISSLFRLYVSHFGNYNRTYGAVGTIVILQLWLYLSSLVVLLGAQLNVSVGEAMRRKKARRARH